MMNGFVAYAYIVSISLSVIILLAFVVSDFHNRIPRRAIMIDPERNKVYKIRYYTALFLFIVINFVLYMVLAFIIPAIPILNADGKINPNFAADLSGVQVISPVFVMLAYIGLGSNIPFIGKNIQIYEQLARLLCWMVRLPSSVLVKIDRRIQEAEMEAERLRNIARNLSLCAEQRGWQDLSTEWSIIEEQERELNQEQNQLKAIRDATRNSTPSEAAIRDISKKIGDFLITMEERRKSLYRGFIRKVVSDNIRDSAIADEVVELFEIEQPEPPSRVVLWARVLCSSAFTAFIGAVIFEVSGESDYEHFIIRYFALFASLTSFFVVVSFVRELNPMLMPVIVGIGGMLADLIGSAILILREIAFSGDVKNIPQALNPTVGFVFGLLVGVVFLGILHISQKTKTQGEYIIFYVGVASGFATYVGILLSGQDASNLDTVVKVATGVLVGLAILFVTGIYDEISEIKSSARLSPFLKGIGYQSRAARQDESEETQ